MRTMMMMSLMVVGLFTLASVDSHAAMGDRDSGIAGVVADADGNTVADAGVKIEGKTRSGREITRRARTDREGRFRVALPPGRYVVTARKDGVGAGRRRAIVQRDEVTRVRIKLERRR